jgi:hypothetical protein
MRVIISLTSIPSRFDKVSEILKNLTRQTCHEIWINIPRFYNRFPDWNGSLPDWINFDPKLRINRDCEDLGPGTKFLGPAKHLDPEDLIVFLDDDTNYDSKMVTNLLKWHKTNTQVAWGLSGFNFESYFRGQYPRQHGVPVDVLEGYGSVIVKAGWIQTVEQEFRELLNVTWHDDILLCNLFEKYGIKRQTVFTQECNLGQIQQYQYGFEPDALHHLAGPGGHSINNLKILKDLQDKGKLYYSYKCS